MLSTQEKMYNCCLARRSREYGACPDHGRLVLLQLYISQASLGADITTAKSSEVNVMVPGSTPDADLVEHAIPEQYVSQYKDGKYVTLPVSHSGG